LVIENSFHKWVGNLANTGGVCVLSKWKVGITASILALTTFTTAVSAEEKLVDQPKWQEWVREHAKKLKEPTAYTYEDLSFLKETVQDKRIVLLGESTHGSTEMNQSKIRIIKYLHEEMDYDVIAFESGFTEANTGYQDLDNLTAEQAMKKSISDVWSTEDVEELFQYIKEQKEKGTPLILTGFDIQIPYKIEKFPFATFASEWIEKLNPEVANLLTEAEGDIFKYRSVSSYKEFQAIQTPLIGKYERIKEFIQQHKNELRQVAPKSLYDVNLLEKTISTRIDSLKTYMSNQMKEQYSIPFDYTIYNNYSLYSRDQKMAQNLAWLSEIQYTGKKIMVWGHNYHIRKQNSKMIKDFTNEFGFVGPNMIDYLPNRIKDQMYTIGLFAYSGSSLDSNDNKTIQYVKEKHESNSIEEILKAAQHPQVFVNLKGEKNRPETSWMYTPIIAQHWGFQDEIMIPNQQYDGILWLEHITPSRIK
jgi:erythromycin esterase